MNNQEDTELKEIVEATFEKQIPPSGKKIFHLGVIVLCSLAVGLITFQFLDFSLNVSAQEEALLRLGWGTMAGLLLSLAGTVVYTIWLVTRYFKAKRMASELIWKNAHERLRNKC